MQSIKSLTVRMVCILALLGGAAVAEAESCNWALRSRTGPCIRESHAMAYDSARNVCVLFGGNSDGGLQGDTWEWDGTTWMQRSPGAPPSARYLPAMAYDSARGVTVLFGGYRGGFMGDTWEWDGTNWTQRTPATTPGQRYAHAIAYDSARSMTVLFGGHADDLMGDTWEYGPLVRIVQHPANCTIVSGCDAGFGVSAAASLGGTLSYQWRKDGAPIPGGSGPGKAFLRIPSAGRGNAGSYDCVVTGSGCEVVSAPATLVVKCRTDFDDDGDVDLADFGVFRACFNGPNRPPAPSCL